jgi:predicted esterase
MVERNIEARTHGRYLVTGPQGCNAPLLVGFHGYAETAEMELARLQQIPGTEKWVRAAVQALHPFYRGRSTDVVASWMTRQNRELAIADNSRYTSNAIHSISKEWSTGQSLVLSGFSQGVAMAFRCATSIELPVQGVIALGGDVPPELDVKALARIPSVLIGRGLTDEWYTTEKVSSDERRLQAAGVEVKVSTFAGGHEWTAEFAMAAALFLQEQLLH